MSRKRENEDDVIKKKRKLIDENWQVDSKVIPTDSHTDAISSRFIRDSSDMHRLLPGRRSFGGFNTAVEKNYNIAMGLQTDTKVESRNDSADVDAIYIGANRLKVNKEKGNKSQKSGRKV